MSMNRVMVERRLAQLQAEKLKRLEHDVRMAKYRRNPDLWLTERFGEDIRSIKWDQYADYENHDWDGDPNPLYQIWKAVALGHWTALESATSTGKTYLLARIVFWFLDCYENSLVVTSAPKQDQLTLHLWSEISRAFHKFQKIRPYAVLNSLRLYADRRQVNGEGDANSWMAVGFVAGVKANEESTTKAQGFHRKDMLIITEETPGMPQPTMTAFENTSTGGNNMILAVGNPDSVTDTLHQFAETSNVKLFRASAYDHPNIVLDQEIVPGAVTRKSVFIRRDKYGEESNFYRSRVRGISPEQSQDSLIRYAWLMSCWVQDPSYLALGPIPDDTRSFNALGVDVANSDAGDAACLAWGRKNALVELQEFYCPNANHLAYNLFYDDIELERMGYDNYHTSRIQDYGILSDHVGVDSVGVGVATVNTLHDPPLNIKAISLQGGQLDKAIPLDNEKKPLYHFQSLRSQMYFSLAQALLNRQIRLEITDPKIMRQLAKELTVLTYTTRGGTIMVTKKEDIKKKLSGKSPNSADALVYWNWMRQGHYQTGAPMMPLLGIRR